MRKLGHGQSVVFCVPREIRTKINELFPDRSHGSDITVSDILLWSIRETWSSLQRGVQLWAKQGWRHRKHQLLWEKFTQGKHALEPDQAKEFLEDEAQTILQRYGPGAEQDESGNPGSTLNGESDSIVDRLRDFGAGKLDGAALSEEQERELQPESEKEREQERPPATVPAAHKMHPDVVRFVENGTITTSQGYKPAFSSLRRTNAGKGFPLSSFERKDAEFSLLVSEDFTQTVKIPVGSGAALDSFLRSVQWVLVSQQHEGKTVMMIISPFEANSLFPTVSVSHTTSLHIYSPRVNPAFPSLDDLQLFISPPHLNHKLAFPLPLTVSLNLFSGQLYFNNFEMYIAACRFLGLSWEKAKDGEVVDSDGFILRDVEGRVGGESGFSRSPVRFMRDLMTIRRDCQAIERTHVGDMLDNRPLSKGSFE